MHFHECVVMLFISNHFIQTSIWKFYLCKSQKRKCNDIESIVIQEHWFNKPD